MIKNLTSVLAKKFGHNKHYIAANIIKLTKKFFGYDFINGKVIWDKLTIYCPDSHIANDLFLKKIILLEYINTNLKKYNITNIQITDIKIINKSRYDENIYIANLQDSQINIDYID